MARYHRTDLARNLPVSTEITGYAVSALIYVHCFSHDDRYLDAARRAALFPLHLAPGASSEKPLEQSGTADTERIVEVLARTCAVPSSEIEKELTRTFGIRLLSSVDSAGTIVVTASHRTSDARSESRSASES